eukprot:gene7413-542_t
MPIAIPGAPGLFHCGWHSEKTYGGASYLIQRSAEEGGNVMVDCPRYNPVLIKCLESMGGVSAIYLTHVDDIGDHAKWAKYFKAPRIMHELEIKNRPDLRDLEIQLEGAGPWNLNGEPLSEDQVNELHASAEAMANVRGPAAAATASRAAAAAIPPPPPVPVQSPPSGADVDAPVVGVPLDAAREMAILLTPGHSLGHTCLLHRPTKTLFSGDHLDAGSGQVEGEELRIFLRYNQVSIPLQLQSVRELLQYDWLRVLPGHGRQKNLRDAFHRLEAVNHLMAVHGEPQLACNGSEQPPAAAAG